jgi:alpha-tubulin suppressor-like RCC1 family protein
MKARMNLIPICLLCAALLQAANCGAQPVTNIAAGGYHSLFLKSGGSLWGTGNNADGELGDGTANNADLPEGIVASNVVAIAGGGYHTLLLKSDGSLWAMGYNGYGALGDGTTDGGNYQTNRPEQIVASNVTAIAAGFLHSLFLKSDGSLWAMGNNGSGQLGDGTFNNTNQPEQIVASNVTAIAAGGYHSLFLKTDGSLWAMGYNGFGELGDGTTDGGNYQTNRPEQIVASNVMAIAAGGGYGGNAYTDHSLFLKRDGSLWAMGDNANGQLGDGTYGGTAGNTNKPEQIIASGITAIASGYFHSLFLKSDGSLWAVGYNGEGELGDGSYGAAPNYGPSQPEQILAAYNIISGQLMNGTNMQLSFVGIARTNYALDRATSLSPPNWIPQTTNPASSFGPLVFTNTPDTTTNNFWRIRSVP